MFSQKRPCPGAMFLLLLLFYCFLTQQCFPTTAVTDWHNMSLMQTKLSSLFLTFPQVRNIRLMKCLRLSTYERKLETQVITQPERIWKNGSCSKHARTHVAFFSSPRPSSLPRLWQVNKINIHPPVAVESMSATLSCHQLCVIWCMGVSLFPTWTVTFSWGLSVKPPPSLFAGTTPLGTPEHIWADALL